MRAQPATRAARRDGAAAGWAWAWPAAAALLGAAILVAFLTPRTPRYDIDVAPPHGRETYAEVLPATIAGYPRALRVIATGSPDVHGARADYGGRVVIDVVHAPSPGALDAFVRRSLEPRLAGYERRSSSHASGTWELQGHGGDGRLHGWQNRDWLFVIEATDDEAFEEAVDRFAFIRRE